MIKPIAFEFPNQLIEASLLIWLEKKDLPKKKTVPQALQKLIQILCSIELPIHIILASLNNFIENYKYSQA